MTVTHNNIPEFIEKIFHIVSDQSEKINFLEERIKELQPEKANIEDELLSAKDAAEMLGVSSSTLWRWEESRQLIPKRLGGKKMYLKSELLKK